MMRYLRQDTFDVRMMLLEFIPKWEGVLIWQLSDKFQPWDKVPLFEKVNFYYWSAQFGQQKVYFWIKPHMCIFDQVDPKENWTPLEGYKYN